VHLLILKYLGETYHSTSHRIIVYVTSGPEAIRLTRLSRDSLGNARTPRIECSFRKPGRKSKSSGGKTTSSKTPAEKSDAYENRTLDKWRATKRKRETSSSEDEDGDDEDNASLADFIVLDDKEVIFGDEERASPRQQNADVEEDGDTDEEDGWKYTMRPAPPPQKKHRKSSSMSAKGKGKFSMSERNIVREGDNDVWILSSD